MTYEFTNTQEYFKVLRGSLFIFYGNSEYFRASSPILKINIYKAMYVSIFTPTLYILVAALFVILLSVIIGGR